MEEGGKSGGVMLLLLLVVETRGVDDLVRVVNV